MHKLFSVGISTKDKNGLQFLYENDEHFSALPTFGIILAQKCMIAKSIWSSITGWTFDFAKVQ